MEYYMETFLLKFPEINKYPKVKFKVYSPFPFVPFKFHINQNHMFFESTCQNCLELYTRQYIKKSLI